MGNPPGVIGKKYRPLKVLKPPSQPVSPSPVPSPPLLATVTASQPLCRFCRAGPGRPSVTDPSSVADVVNLYIRYWRAGRADCLELASPIKNSSKTGEFSGFFRNFRFGVFRAFFLGRRVANFRRKRNAHCYERLVSTSNTSVKSLQIDPTLLVARL